MTTQSQTIVAMIVLEMIGLIKRLNVVGSVIADTVSLKRDLGLTNSTTPSESFTFNPELLFTMPDALKEAPYVWQEVAP